MPDGAQLAWMLAVAAFGAIAALAAHFARRDRQAISDELTDLSAGLAELHRIMDSMRKELHLILMDHERRLSRLEAKMEDTIHGGSS